MLAKHGAFTSTLLNNGLVLITGWSKETELFDPKTNKFKLSGNLNYPRNYHTATLLKDGRVLIVGGRSVNPDISFNEQDLKYAEYSEIYDPKTEKFEIGPKINVPRSEHSSVLLNDGNVLIIGGISSNKADYTPELYILNKNKFIKLKEKSYSSLVNSSPILLECGKVLIRSCDFHNSSKDLLEIYDPKTRTFKFFFKYPGKGTNTLLNNGNVIYIAGSKKERWYAVSTKDSTILNTKTKEFIKGPDLMKKRSGHTATLLKDGTVLITGGYDNQTLKSIKTSELYIP